MLEALRDAARAKATERTWSQGVALARDGRVGGRAGGAVAGPGSAGPRSAPGGSAESIEPAREISLEVRVPGRPTPFEVTLYPSHGDWECSCDGRDAVCSHVVAGVLSAVNAARDGGEVPDGAARGLGDLRY